MDPVATIELYDTQRRNFCFAIMIGETYLKQDQRNFIHSAVHHSTSNTLSFLKSYILLNCSTQKCAPTILISFMIKFRSSLDRKAILLHIVIKRCYIFQLFLSYFILSNLLKQTILRCASYSSNFFLII